MSFFDLDPVATQNVLDRARMSPLDPETLKPGWFAGLWKAPVTGLAAVLNDAALLAGDAGTPVARAAVRPVDQLFKTNLEGWLVSEQQKAVDNIKEWAPDPRTSGIVTQAVHGLFNIVPEAIAGGPATAALLQGYKGFRGGMAEGLDPGTAFGKGAIDGVSTWVGMKIPMTVAPGLGAAANIGAAAAVNVPVGMVSRGVTGDWLRARGYPEMANQYQVLDAAAITMDLIMGGGFGALAHYGPGAVAKYDAWRRGNESKILPSDRDTALYLNAALHAELDTAPGIPTDPAARAAHAEALNKALQDLLAGREVTAPEGVIQAQFLDNPSAAATRVAIVDAVADHYGAEWAALKAELDRRGLPGDDVDVSGPALVAPTGAALEVPGAVAGKQSSVKIEGQYQRVRWALVDASQVEATLTKSDNQFRDRTRAASEAQVNKIAQDPDFNLLTESPLMDYGAPTMTRDGRIVGGNGRFAGLSRAYDLGTGDKYRTPLVANLQRFGIDPAQAQGMKKPVLVRVIEGDVDVKRAAIASNEGGGARMSELEQAKVDAVRLPDLNGFDVDAAGRTNTAGNRGHIRQWIGQFPENERGALMDARGTLSAEGERRLRNAILYQAFGDTETLARLVESTDPGARNVAAAAIKTAATVAQAKASMQAGSMFPVDISADFAAAIEVLDRLRREGTKVPDYLNQMEMLGSELTPEARTILEFLDKNIRSAKAIGEMITGFYDRVRAAGDPNQGSMLGPVEAPPKDQVLKQAIEAVGQEKANELLDAQVSKALPKKELDRLPAEAQGALREMYRAAMENKAQFDDIGRAIAEALGGQYMDAPIKGATRAIDKIVSDYAGDASKIRDLLRSSIVVDDPVRALAAVEELRRQFEVLDSGARNLFSADAAPQDGYRDAKLNVVINGHIAEVQVHIPEMLEAKKEVHDLYAQRTAIERKIGDRNGKATAAERKKIDALNAKMREAYDAAWAEATSRVNSASEMGAPLRLADSGENLRGGSVSQAAQNGTLPGMSPSETGMPSTSKSSTELGNFIGFSADIVADSAGGGKFATADVVSPILRDSPDMMIPDEAGQSVRASDALAAADAAITKAKQDSQGYEAAATCALRG